MVPKIMNDYSDASNKANRVYKSKAMNSGMFSKPAAWSHYAQPAQSVQCVSFISKSSHVQLVEKPPAVVKI